MKRYKHKATSIEEVDNRKFMSEAEAQSIKDKYLIKAPQVVNVDTNKEITSTQDGNMSIIPKAKSMCNLLQHSPGKYKIIYCDADGVEHRTFYGDEEVSLTFGELENDLQWMYLFIGENEVGYKLKPSTVYTVFIDLYLKNDYPGSLNCIIQRGNSQSPITNQGWFGAPKKGWNRMRATVRTIDNFLDLGNGRSVYTWLNTSASVMSNNKIIVKNAMVFEGDIPMEEYPGYIDTYSNTLDDSTIIRSCNSDNLLDISKVEVYNNANILDVDPSKGYIKFKKINNDGGAFIYLTVDVEMYQYYNISWENDDNYKGLVYVYEDVSNFYEGFCLASGVCPTFYSGKYKKIKVGLYIDASTNIDYHVRFNKLRMTKGKDAKEFVPYKGSEIKIDALSLKSLENRIYDTIEGNKIIRRVGKLIFNGSEPWQLLKEDDRPSDSLTIGFVCYCEDSWNVVSETLLASDRFTFYRDNAMYYNGDREKIGRFTNSNAIIIRVNRKEKAATAEEFKQWLKSNNVTVYYELKQYFEEPVDKYSLPSFSNTTTITSDNGLSIPLEVIVNRDTQSIITSMKDEVIEQSNKLSYLKGVQLSILNNLI